MTTWSKLIAHINPEKPSSTKGPESISSELLKASLDFLREDAITSRETQHRIIQSYGTIYASILVGGIVYASRTSSPADPLIIMSLYGIAAPGFSIVSTIAFLGEVIRMGRAAMASRGIEWWISRNASYHLQGTTGPPFPPVFVEAFYSSLNAKQRSTQSHGTGVFYTAIMALFGGSLLVALLLCNAFLWHWTSGVLEIAGTQLRYSIIVSAIWLVIWTVGATATIRTIQKMGRRVPDFPIELTFGKK